MILFYFFAFLISLASWLWDCIHLRNKTTGKSWLWSHGVGLRYTNGNGIKLAHLHFWYRCREQQCAVVPSAVHWCQFMVRSCLTLGSVSPLIPLRKELGRGFRKSQDCQLLSKNSKWSGTELAQSGFVRDSQGDFVFDVWLYSNCFLITVLIWIRLLCSWSNASAVVNLLHVFVFLPNNDDVLRRIISWVFYTYQQWSYYNFCSKQRAHL